MQTLYRKELGHCLNSYFKFVIGDNVEECVYCIEERQFEAPTESSIVLQKREYDNAMKYVLQHSEQCSVDEWNKSVVRASNMLGEF